MTDIDKDYLEGPFHQLLGRFKRRVETSRPVETEPQRGKLVFHILVIR
jgi:hypothetical protein